MTTRAFVDQFCANLPGASWADHNEGGLNAWKVGGKIFACLGTTGDGVSVKTASPEAASFLIDMGRASKAPYFHRSWVRVPFSPVAQDEMRDRIQTSYDLVRSTLPKKTQAALDP